MLAYSWDLHFPKDQPVSLFGPPHSQIVLLPPSPRILRQHPLNLPTAILLQRATLDLETSHRHPRPDLGQLDILVTRLHKDVVPHLDAVLDILERDNPVPDPVRAVPGREDVLQNLDDAFAEFGLEAFEDEVWVGFGNGAAGGVGNVGAQDDVVQGKRGRGAVGEMRDRQRGWGASVFV